MINGITIVICQVADMGRACSFYRDVLGMTPGVATPYWSDFSAGGVRIGLHPPFEGSEPPYAVRGKGWIVGLQTDDIQGLRRKVEDAGVWTAEDFHDVPTGVVWDFADPDGNPLQAMQAGVKAQDLR